MYLPPLQPLSNSNSYVSGDVTVDPSAAIAPGVLILAEPNSRIVIAAGVSIGMGSIVHARQGTIEIEAGAVLGAGVLVVGSGKIGANACIGASTTIMSSSIEPGKIIPSGSLIGDESRKIVESLTPEAEIDNSASASVDNHQTNTESPSPAGVDTTEESAVADATQETKAPPSEDRSLATPVSMPIYGQVHLNQLLSTLFPHNKAVNQPLTDGQTE